MIVESAKKEDCAAVAKIHLAQINQGFLSSLGDKFLSLFYEAMINSENAFLLVARENERIVGFVSGCIDIGKFYGEFFKKYKVKAFFILLKKVFSFNFLKKVLEVKKYAQKKSKDIPSAELLSIAVVKEFQGRGLAKHLLESFIAEAKKRDIQVFKAVVGKNLILANKFYQKNGFQFYSKSFVHKDTPSNIYLYKIK